MARRSDESPSHNGNVSLTIVDLPDILFDLLFQRFTPTRWQLRRHQILLHLTTVRTKINQSEIEKLIGDQLVDH